MRVSRQVHHKAARRPEPVVEGDRHFACRRIDNHINVAPRLILPRVYVMPCWLRTARLELANA
ncbi:MAG: hypothetical protein CMQ61_09790 [Gammaproteobacteria bacterium]|nr:hypothetical protein [Gammaproteobacteria bacterium]